jgi:putative tRNA adenosine deaminase-associated protein
VLGSSHAGRFANSIDASFVVWLALTGHDLAAFLRVRDAGLAAMTDVSDSSDDTDFVIIVYREEDQWEADVLPAAVTADFTGFLEVLSQQPSLGGTIGFVGVGDEAFIAVRVLGTEVSALLSDVLAAVDYSLAREVLEFLEIDVPDEDDVDQILPAGDLSIFADLGLDEMDLGMIVGDVDLYPDDAVLQIAERLGFGPAADRALDIALGP